MPDTPPSLSLRTLQRKALRQQRRALTAREQRQHARALARAYLTSGLLRRYQRLALYLESDGEIGTGALIDQLHHAGKQLYLPVLRDTPSPTLWFCRYRPGDPLLTNRFSIAEPDPRRNRPVSPLALDLVMLPLVGFDLRGNRIGMGGGYYDRTFAYLQRHRYWLQPRLLGMAHSLQQLANIEAHPWDIPLDGVLTERGLIQSRINNLTN